MLERALKLVLITPWQVGLPMMSFVLLGAYGIQYTLKNRLVDRDRRRRAPIQQESTEDILVVSLA
jgi:hypothetical protein